MSKTPSNLSETSFKTISTIRHDNSQTIDNKRNNELEDINYRIKDVSKNNKPYQELNQCSYNCLLYTSPSPRDSWRSRMPSSA